MWHSYILLPQKVRGSYSPKYVCGHKWFCSPECFGGEFGDVDQGRVMRISVVTGSWGHPGSWQGLGEDR